MTGTNPLDRIAAISAARTAASKLLPDIDQPGGEHRFAVQLAERLAAGEDIGPEVFGEYTEMRRAADDRAAFRGVLRTVTAHLSDLLHQAEREAVPYRLAQLGRDLGALVDQARTLLPALAGARSAETAIERGAADAWQRMTELGGRYGALRTRQAALTGELMSDGHGALTRVKRHGILANVREVWPDAVKHDANEMGEPAPWPHERGRPYDTPHGREFLIWLAETPEARPWVPSVDQLDRAAAAARDAVSAYHLAKATTSKTNDSHPYPMGATA